MRFQMFRTSSRVRYRDTSVSIFGSREIAMRLRCRKVACSLDGGQPPVFTASLTAWASANVRSQMPARASEFRSDQLTDARMDEISTLDVTGLNSSPSQACSRFIVGE